MSKTIITGSRLNQEELIDQAIEWLNAKREDKYLNHQMAIIIEIHKEDN